jgi:glutaryl-CoA dehydrogenase
MTTSPAAPATPPASTSDYYLLDELLTDEARDVRDRVRSFVDRDLLPVINDYWDRAEFPFELIGKIAQLGVAGSTIEGYGCPGLSRLAAGIVTREMSRGDGSVNTFLGVQSGLSMGAIALLGSEEQKQRWLPGMAALDKIGAFALTEPGHGSDAVRLDFTKSASVSDFSSTRMGNLPCSSGIRSLGLDTWIAPAAMNRMWSVRSIP